MIRTHKQWKYNEISVACLGFDKKTPNREIADLVNRSLGSINALEWLYADYKIGRKQYVSKSLQRYFEAHLNGVKPEVVQTQPSLVTVQPTENPFAILDAKIEDLKGAIADVIANTVEEKVRDIKEQNKTMATELIALRQFKDSVKTTSTWIDLSKRLGNMA